ncbi:unnamed protein product [Rotaria sp. Silwood2]|nr:unnamed protein product [Rotaria sp. Silwood2]CAF4083914.1 unnamed protein product [Rotaria sp. Silwood2]
MVQETLGYDVISMDKPDDSLFDSIPKDWQYNCKDVMLGLLYYPQTSKIVVGQSSGVEIWVITPPHRINNNDTVIIEWAFSRDTDCKDCLT